MNVKLNIFFIVFMQNFTSIIEKSCGKINLLGKIMTIDFIINLSFSENWIILWTGLHFNFFEVTSQYLYD